MTRSYEEKYTNFIKSHSLCDFQQSIEWARLKKNWKNEIIFILDENKEIIATMSILIRKLPFFGNLMYVPRGPICDIHDKEVLKKLTRELQKLAEEYHAFGVRIEPNVEKLDLKFQRMIEALGYQIYSSATNFYEEIQARHNFRLDLKNKTEEQVFQSFESKTRYNIRLAIKKNVQIEKMGIEGIDIFYKLYEETGKRDQFCVRKKDYFITMLKQFDPKDITILVAYYQGKPIASIIPIICGRKMWYLYGASGNENRNVMPNYLLQWTAIKEAIKQGIEVYDFRGVCIKKDGNLDGLYRFKKGFGADFVELIGEIYIPFKPIRYYLYKIVEKNFRLLRAKNYQRKCKKEERKKRKNFSMK